VTAPRPNHADTFLQQLAAVARLLAEHGGTQRCALPGCNKPVPFDIANPRQCNDYCGPHHARKSRVSTSHAVDPSPSARPQKPYCRSNHKNFVLTPAMRACAICDQCHLNHDCPAMRACAICDQRHLDRNFPRIMLSDPGAPADATALAASRRFLSAPDPFAAAAFAEFQAATRNATARVAQTHDALSSDPDGIPGAADAAAPPPGLRLLDHGPDAVTAAPPAHLPSLSPCDRPWLPGGNAALNAPLPAEDAVERRDTQIAQTYDARSSDGSDYAPRPRQHTTHTTADKEWFAAARRERSTALFQIDALESRLRLAGDHYQDLLRAFADQKEFIAVRDARDNTCWTPSPPASPPASP